MLLLAIYSTVGPGRNVVANSECRGVVVESTVPFFRTSAMLWFPPDS